MSPKGRRPDLLRIGVVDLVAQVVAAQNHHETVLAHRLDKHLHAGDFDLLKLLAHGHAALGRGPARPAIADESFANSMVQSPPHGNIARPYLEINAQRFENTPADSIFQRVVAEQPKVSWAAPGCNARQDRNGQSAHAFTYTSVQVGGTRGLQFGLAAHLDRQAAQAVRYHKDDFGAIILTKVANEMMNVHEREFTGTRCQSTVSKTHDWVHPWATSPSRKR